MYVLDTTALIALVSELTHNERSIHNLPAARLKYLSLQINEEIAHPKALLMFFQSFSPLYIFESNLEKATKIITTIGGENEKLRFQQLLSTSIVVNPEPEEEFTIITANKKLYKALPKHYKFIFHTPRSLLGL